MTAMTLLNKRRGLYQVTHTLDGAVVWKSPIISADDKTDAALQAHAMRSDFDPTWPLIGEPPKGYCQTVELIREANA
jgi:hypothetical protein